MHSGIARLLARYLGLALGVLLLNFLIPRFLPGDPLAFTSGQGLDAAVPMTAAAKQQLRVYYDLDAPLSRQLADYLRDLAQGDLGWSISRSAPVSQLILTRLPWTGGLLLTALLVAASLGLALGVLAGWAPGRRRGRLLVSAAGALAAVPEFLIGIGLLLVFTIGLGWFPLFGGRSVFAPAHSGAVGWLRQLLDVARHLTLPALTLVLAGLPGFLLLARDTSVRLSREPWVALARAKGLSERQIVRRHALPNIRLPLLTFLGLRLGTVLGGALVVERVFGVPGLGLLGFQAIQARDYPVLQALFLLSSLGVLAANLAVEIVYHRLDHRAGARHA